MFYQQLLIDWKELSTIQKEESKLLSYLFEPLWFNNNIKIKKKSIVWHHWIKKGDLYIKDVLEVTNKEIMNINQFKNKYNLTNFLEILQIEKAIPFVWRQYIKNHKSEINLNDLEEKI